jgi:Flp pilus assembly protein TadG
MRTKIGWFTFLNFSRFTKSVVRQINRKGQALVEFTLVFLLLLVVAWIPADFGLAFYTGQIAQNAVREGARIAAADPTLTTINSTCGPPLSACFGFGNIFNETAVRLPSALMGATTSITVRYPSPASSGCNQLVEVTASGQYSYFFYHLLRLMRIQTSPVTIQRSQAMRWEHLAACPSF